MWFILELIRFLHRATLIALRQVQTSGLWTFPSFGRLTADRRTSRLTNSVVAYRRTIEMGVWRWDMPRVGVRHNRIMQLFPPSRSAHIQIVGCTHAKSNGCPHPRHSDFLRSWCRAKTASPQPPCPFARFLGLRRLGTGPSVLENSGTPLLPISSSHLGKRALTSSPTTSTLLRQLYNHPIILR